MSFSPWNSGLPTLPSVLPSPAEPLPQASGPPVGRTRNQYKPQTLVEVLSPGAILS